MKKRTLIAVLALVLVFGSAFAGSWAWLQDETQSIENVFIIGDNIDIDLTETTTEYKVVPGATIEKDPTVKVINNADGGCWVFVKVESNLPDYITYEIDKAWTALDGVDGVYYIENAAIGSYSVLAGDQVVVDADVTDVSDAEGATLTFTAYAIQKEAGTTAAEAWAKF